MTWQMPLTKKKDRQVLHTYNFDDIIITGVLLPKRNEKLDT